MIEVGDTVWCGSKNLWNRPWFNPWRGKVTEIKHYPKAAPGHELIYTVIYPGTMAHMTASDVRPLSPLERLAECAE